MKQTLRTVAVHRKISTNPHICYSYASTPVKEFPFNTQSTKLLINTGSGRKRQTGKQKRIPKAQAAGRGRP